MRGEERRPRLAELESGARTRVKTSSRSAINDPRCPLSSSNYSAELFLLLSFLFLPSRPNEPRVVESCKRLKDAGSRRQTFDDLIVRSNRIRRNIVASFRRF